MEVVQRLDDRVYGEEMYCIKQIKDTQLRETCGFALGGDLYLWPEEAWYLLNRFDVTTLDDDISTISRADIASFYSHM